MTDFLPRFIYPYILNRSRRARNVRLKATADGLIVVVPEGFCVSRDLLPILESKKNWIEKALSRVSERADVENKTKGLPSLLELRALGETWRVKQAVIGVGEDGARKIIFIPKHDENEAIEALRRWLHEKARRELPRLLIEEAQRHRFSYSLITVKGQKHIWGSCSSRGNINLNRKLLFLPKNLSRYVLLHELCHLREMNHSALFYKELSRVDPNFKENAAELKLAWKYVPGWVSE
ncbi:zinc protease [Synergistales bacterium]|nr:zinc protease [Synergistales bacterium]